MHVAGYHDFIALGNQAGTSCNTTPDYIVHGTFVVLVVLVFLQPVLQLSYQTFSSHFTFITVVLMLLIHIFPPLNVLNLQTRLCHSVVSILPPTQTFLLLMWRCHDARVLGIIQWRTAADHIEA